MIVGRTPWNSCVFYVWFAVRVEGLVGYICGCCAVSVLCVCDVRTLVLRVLNYVDFAAAREMACIEYSIYVRRPRHARHDNDAFGFLDPGGLCVRVKEFGIFSY